MAIYADKRDGALTGRWCVEVEQGGRRTRGRANSLVEARAMEQVFKGAEGSKGSKGSKGSAPASVATPLHGLAHGKRSPITLVECSRAWGRALWERAGHQAKNLRKIEIIVEIKGDIAVTSITREWLVDLVGELEAGREASPGTINRYLSAVSSLLKEAADRDLIPKSPKIPWRVESAGRLRWVSPEEENTMLTLLRGWGEDRVALFVEMALATGLRRGELLRVKGEHIDGRWIRVWETKTGEPRSVPLPERLRVAFAAQGASWGSPEAFVNRLRCVWPKLMTAMQLGEDDQFCVHALRHTTATRLVQVGVNLRVIMAYMGHRSIQTTLRYAHVNDLMLAGAADAQEALRGPRSVLGEPGWSQAR